MRLFVALDIDNDIRDRIGRFLEEVRNFAPDARWTKEESLHITLKFIGEQPENALTGIKQALSTITASAPQINLRGYGFFPSAKSARVFWIGLEAGPELAALASAINTRLSPLGIVKDKRKFSPHLTLARSRGAPGREARHKKDRGPRTFQPLQDTLAAQAAPEFGSMTCHEFFLYQSHLSPKGSTYTKLAKFALG